MKIIDFYNSLLFLNFPKILLILLLKQLKSSRFFWHQAEVPRQETITQGVQKEIELFGEKKVVGYYNSYSPVAQGEKHDNDVMEGERLMYRQTENQVSMQFHPESIMSKDGFDILKESILNLVS